MPENNVGSKINLEEEPVTRRAARVIAAEGYELADLDGLRVRGVYSINPRGIGILTQRPEPEPVGCLGMLVELANLTFDLITCRDGDEVLETRARFVGALYTDHSEWKLRVVGRDNMTPLKGLMEKILKEDGRMPPVTISLAREEPLYEQYLIDRESDAGEIDRNSWGFASLRSG